MPGPPAPFERRFHDLSTVVDEVHAVFDTWVESGAFAGDLDEFGLLVMKLAVHEWIANLVQHAAFRVCPPEIGLTVHAEPGGLRCIVEDNSEGFDFQGQVAVVLFTTPYDNPVDAESYAAHNNLIDVHVFSKLMDLRKTEPEVGSTTKECPECLSSIPNAARRCAFCTAEVGAA